MMHFLRRAWSGVVSPILPGSKRTQVAALCYKDTAEGKKVLLITSRDTGRWIVPKGWPIKGKNGSQSALQEAWEEAGVKEATIETEPVGTYDYEKGLKDGESLPVRTQVYMTKVQKLSEEYPEVDERERAWFPPREAANKVDEPDLKALLEQLHKAE